MFSGRTPASLAPNRLSQLLAERKAAGAPILDLTVSKPTGVGLAYPRAEILAALDDPRSLSYEPTARGLAEARRASRSAKLPKATALTLALTWRSAPASCCSDSCSSRKSSAGRPAGV